MILIVDSDKTIAECVAKACRAEKREVKVAHDALGAMMALEEEVPELIFMDVLLTGPDGFAFLNELITYEDTAKIPVVVMSEVKFDPTDLSDYGVVEVMDKDAMTPAEVRKYVQKYAK